MSELANIERMLLEREVSRLKTELAGIGRQLSELFNPYGDIHGQHGNEVGEWLAVAVMDGVKERYCAGYKTRIGLTFPQLPECLRQLIAQRVAQDFLKHVDEIRAVTDVM